MSATEHDEEDAEEIRELGRVIGLAIYETVRVATSSPSKGGQNRTKIGRIWTNVANELIAFAKKGA